MVAGMTRHRFPALLLIAAVLGGCSSRSGTTTAPAPPPPAPPAPPPAPAPDPCVPTHGGDCLPAPEFEETADALSGWMTLHPGFQNQWGLEEIGAHRAYAHVRLLEGPDAEPGAGVTIGFVDTGIDVDHPVFAGRSIYVQPLLGAEPETGVDRFSHGTAVASVAAGGRIDTVTGSHGVAWGADLAMWALPLGSGGGPFDPITLEEIGADDLAFAHVFGTAFAWRDAGNRLDILNLSFGTDGFIEHYSAVDLRANIPEMVATLAQAGADEKTILVWAAGNEHGARCVPAPRAA